MIGINEHGAAYLVVGVRLLEDRRNEILEEGKVELISMAMRRLEWFGQMKIRHEIENIRAVAKMASSFSTLYQGILET